MADSDLKILGRAKGLLLGVGDRPRVEELEPGFGDCAFLDVFLDLGGLKYERNLELKDRPVCPI